MTRDEILDEFRASGALLEGHFILTSGLRSPVYLQCAKLLMHPERAARFCCALAEALRQQFGDDAFDLVVSPAMGGVIVGYELGRQLDVPAIFAERVDGAFALRRGFEITEGARVVMAEDIVTTGLSSRECIACIEAHGGNVIAACCLVDRSAGEVDVGVPLVSLLPYKVPAYPADQLPRDLAELPAVKPGSRGLR